VRDLEDAMDMFILGDGSITGGIARPAGLDSSLDPEDARRMLVGMNRWVPRSTRAVSTGPPLAVPEEADHKRGRLALVDCQVNTTRLATLR